MTPDVECTQQYITHLKQVSYLRFLMFCTGPIRFFQNKSFALSQNFDCPLQNIKLPIHVLYLQCVMFRFQPIRLYHIQPYFSKEMNSTYCLFVSHNFKILYLRSDGLKSFEDYPVSSSFSNSHSHTHSLIPTLFLFSSLETALSPLCQHTWRQSEWSSTTELILTYC